MFVHPIARGFRRLVLSSSKTHYFRQKQYKILTPVKVYFLAEMVLNCKSEISKLTIGSIQSLFPIFYSERF